MVALMAKIEHAFPNSFSFVIAGDGPDRVNIQQAIVQHGMQQKIALLGKQENAAEFLAGIDVFLMTSSTEGLPLTLIEALQQGCFPAIAIQSKLTEIPLDKMGVRFALDNPKPIFDFLSYLISLPETKREELQLENRNIILSKFDFAQYMITLTDYYRKAELSA
jgi:glycosyltransferase involved in cell wall biosynthesis